MRNLFECFLEVKENDINGFSLVEYIDYIFVKINQVGETGALITEPMLGAFNQIVFFHVAN